MTSTIEEEILRVRPAAGTVRILVTGSLTQKSIEKLIANLEMLKNEYPPEPIILASKLP